MKVSLGKSTVYLLALAVAGMGAACSSSSSGGTGGSTGSGGHTGAGGSTVGTGGSTAGTGGHGTGGITTGTGGATTGTGGATTVDAGPDAVATGTGGASGDAATGTGGASGDAAVDGPPPIVGTALATFDTIGDGGDGLEGFALINDGKAGNLGFPPDGGTAATLVWTGTDGSPAPGSLESVAPFSDYNQDINIQRGFANTNLQDWTGKTKLHVRVKVASGLNPSPSNPALAYLYITTYSAPVVDGGSPGYNYGQTPGGPNIVPGNGWNDYVFDFSTQAAPFDPSKVINFGVSIITGNGGTADGGTNPMKPTPAVIFIDSFSIE